ncbi:metal-dependent hydrolase [Candidatus Kaiserbacteria bacterium]|nr:metal-dependent hydrolase [Candidatus Kaiserbacteria bacterium]
MKKIKNVLALLADVANGLLATILAGLIVGIEPSWHFIVGIIFAMSPDLDALPELLKRGRVAASAGHNHDHREALHYPVIFILAGIIFIYLAPFWGWLFLIAVLLHFFNDFYGTGWGIPLLWPITKRRYKLLGRRANLLKSILIERGLWENLPDSEKRLRIIVSWSEAELSDYINRFGIEDWIEKYYLRLNWVSITEYIAFSIAIFLVFINFK